MNQQQRLQLVAQAHEFSLVTNASPAEVLSVLDAAATAACHSDVQGTINRLGVNKTANVLDSAWEIRGPDGIAKLMTFRVKGTPFGRGSTAVAMTIGEYNYQKRARFRRPTLEGSRRIKAFANIVRTQLAAAPIRGSSGLR